MRADGSRVRPLTDAGGFFAPDWSPDGRRIVLGRFSRSDVGREEVFVMDADGSNLTRLTRTTWTNTRPSWSPDGTTIAFASRRGGDLDLYLMDPDGGNVRRLTTSPGRDTEPVWSADGSLIAFISSRRAAAQDVYLIRPDGTGLRRLTNSKALDWAPAWSLDGSRIAFTRSRYEIDRQLIVVIDISNGERTRIAISAQYELQPDWRPIEP
jgi:Tol biopolymer transport system component